MSPFPDHFVVRPGPPGREDAIVPLIAVDQLPDWMQLVGIPRELDVEQAAGLVNLGLMSCASDDTYEVRLRTDKIRAIMSVKDEDANEGPLAPSDSVSSAGRAVGQGQNRDSTTAASQKQEDDTESAKTSPRIPSTGHSPVHLFAETAGTTSLPAQTFQILEPAGADAAPRVPTARAWADESDSASSEIPGGVLDTLGKSQMDEKRTGDGEAKQRKAAPEPGLSASRHNTANGAAEDEFVRKDKDIRPHLTEDARSRRLLVPRTKDKFFGTNPDTVYCRHWCHYGTCKWNWECRYQHRMPPNLDGLREVGLKDFPTWYLLMMAGGGYSGSTIGAGGLGANHSMALHDGMNLSMNMNAMNLAMPTHNSLLSGLGRPSYPSDAFLDVSSRQHLPPHNPSPMELRLMQGRMSALLAGSTSMSNRQKLRQIKEMRELFLRSNTMSQSANSHHTMALPGPGYASLIGMGNYGFHQGRANLHTNASLAANAAGLSAASRRQALREAERGANAPVEIPSETIGAKKGKDGTFDELEGRLTPLGSDEGGTAEKQNAVREGKLVDIE